MLAQSASKSTELYAKAGRQGFWIINHRKLALARPTDQVNLAIFATWFMWEMNERTPSTYISKVAGKTMSNTHPANGQTFRRHFGRKTGGWENIWRRVSRKVFNCFLIIIFMQIKLGKPGLTYRNFRITNIICVSLEEAGVTLFGFFKLIFPGKVLPSIHWKSVTLLKDWLEKKTAEQLSKQLFFYILFV